MPAATQSTAAGTAKSDEPQTPAARRAAGLPPLEGQDAESQDGADGAGGTDGQQDGADGAGGTDEQQDAADGAASAPAASAAAAAGRHVTQVPGGEPATPENITKEELETIRMLRSSRGAEIRDALAAAPIGVGTDHDPYVLVHKRGCPAPDQTETYDSERPGGQTVTIERCMTCGAQNIIDH